jgi:hypothetical protein
MKNRPVGAEWEQKHGQIDMTDLILDFRSSVKAPKNVGSHSTAVSTVIVQELKIWAISLFLNKLL